MELPEKFITQEKYSELAVQLIENSSQVLNLLASYENKYLKDNPSFFKDLLNEIQEHRYKAFTDHVKASMFSDSEIPEDEKKEREATYHFWENLYQPIKEKAEKHKGISNVNQSNIYLNKNQTGSKIDLIRIINTLYELNYFVGENHLNVPTKKEVMTLFGKMLNIDLSKYEKDLNQAYDRGSNEANVKIFNSMIEKTENLIKEVLEKRKNNS